MFNNRPVFAFDYNLVLLDDIKELTICGLESIRVLFFDGSHLYLSYADGQRLKDDLFKLWWGCPGAKKPSLSVHF